MKKVLLTTLSLAVALSLNAKVLATADSIEVTEEEIRPFLIQPEDGMHGAMGMPGSGEITAEDKKNLVDNIIKYKLLIKKAKDSGVEKDAEFKKNLEAAKDSIAFQIWQKKEFDKVKVSDEEIKKFYKDKAETFMKPEQIKAKHILVEDENTAKDIIAKLEKVEKLKLKEEFGKIAGEKSKDPTAKQNGGDLGWFNKNQMIAGFEAAAFELKDGEISKTPIKTDFGYHIILKEESKAAEPIALESVKGMIAESIKAEKFQKQLEDEAEKLFKEAKVTYTEATK